MARIAGIDLPNQKRVEIALTYIFGIGRPTASRLLAVTAVNPNTRVKDLTDTEVARIQEAINADHIVEGELQRLVSGNIKRLKDIKSYRGQRHSQGLPSRGQRTKTNARTRRGKKVTVGGTAKKVASKT